MRTELRRTGSDEALQPVHLQSLVYLSKANRYSNTPQALADYLGLTKGTVSQTLLLLDRRGLIERFEDDIDRRVVRLRLSSAGEPLTPEVNEWARSALGGLQVHDHFGQTEVGMVLANCHHPALARPLKAGSMGRAIPGWELTVLAEDADVPAGPGVLGRVAVDVPASPFMTFTDYQTAGQADAKFSADGRWYLTGDSSRVDADGDFFFSSRDDDVIIMAGYRIGPFEIESVLSQHPAVAECVVVAAPDEVRGEVIEAHVVPREGSAGTPELAAELQQFVKTRYAAHAYPRTVHFRDALPKTPSGKIQRYLLRDRGRPAATGAPA